MPELQLLRPDHAAAVLEFEVANRAWFASSISDRGDAYFEHFADEVAALLRAQRAGTDAHHVLVDDDGAVLGRFNLVRIGHGSADLGYRVAQRASGRGLATASVRELCRLAPASYGVRRIRAATSSANTTSQQVLRKAGFVEVGPAHPADLGGKQGTWFERVLGVDPSGDSSE